MVSDIMLFYEGKSSTFKNNFFNAWCCASQSNRARLVKFFPEISAAIDWYNNNEIYRTHCSRYYEYKIRCKELSTYINDAVAYGENEYTDLKCKKLIRAWHFLSYRDDADIFYYLIMDCMLEVSGNMFLDIRAEKLRHAFPELYFEIIEFQNENHL